MEVVNVNCTSISSFQLGMVAYSYNSSTYEAETGEFLQVWNQPGLHSQAYTYILYL